MELSIILKQFSETLGSDFIPGKVFNVACDCTVLVVDTQTFRSSRRQVLIELTHIEHLHRERVRGDVLTLI